MEKRNKPKFRRKDWHKKIKLGSKDKKNVKWRGAKGRQNKIRLGIRGHNKRPKIGWGTKKDERGKVAGFFVARVENLSELENINKDTAIVIASVGEKKKEDIIRVANERKIKILNKYRKEKK